MKKITPDYKRIYTDLVNEKYPEKKEQYEYILSKESFSILDVIAFNKLLFKQEDKNTFIFNQKHRMYDEQTILAILNYQKTHKCNNTQLAFHFDLSRNTVAKWKKSFLV